MLICIYNTNIYLYNNVLNSRPTVPACWCFKRWTHPSLLHCGLTSVLPLLPFMEEAKRTQRQIHMYNHTCWVGTRLTSAEQRAGPPITEHRACGLAPLVRVSAAPCPPSQKQGNGLCYSLLLTLQQTWGWVHAPLLYHTHTHTHTHTPLPLLAACSLLSLLPFPLCKLFSILSILSPDVCQMSSPKPPQQWRCKSAHAVHFLALSGVHTCSVQDVITAHAWEWFAAG